MMLNLHPGLSERWIGQVSKRHALQSGVLCFSGIVPRGYVTHGLSQPPSISPIRRYTSPFCFLPPHRLGPRAQSLSWSTFSKPSSHRLSDAKFASVGSSGGNDASSSQLKMCKADMEPKLDYKAASDSRMTSPGRSVALVKSEAEDMPTAPKFDHHSLFHDMVEEYASRMTTLSSEDFLIITEETGKAGLFAPCMVGKLEGQFLKMITTLKKAKKVLDIGTFTGFSALAFAEALPDDGQVLTLESEERAAEVAQICFDRAKHGKKIKLVKCDARTEVDRLADSGEKFDIIFLDADKVSYKRYYDASMRMLNEDGLIMADNALCSLVYSEDDPGRQALHEFAEFVRTDDRVEQVMLTVREGILMIQKKQ